MMPDVPHETNRCVEYGSVALVCMAVRSVAVIPHITEPPVELNGILYVPHTDHDPLAVNAMEGLNVSFAKTTSAVEIRKLAKANVASSLTHIELNCMYAKFSSKRITEYDDGDNDDEEDEGTNEYLNSA